MEPSKPRRAIDLANASISDSDLRRVVNLLRRREIATLGAAVCLLVLGIPATFLGPFVFTCLYWTIAMFSGTDMRWTWVFWGTCIVIIPLLFWTEWRNKGEYFASAIGDSFDRGSLPLLGLGNLGALIAFAQNPRASTIGLVELFLWGPGQILDGTTKLWQMFRLRRVSRNRAAAILAALSRGDRADIGPIKEQARQSAEILVALMYCIRFRWIGISKDGDRVWLDTDSRDRLFPLR